MGSIAHPTPQAQGWGVIGPDPAIAAWAAAALAPARAAIAADPAGWRSGGTWHVGLDALPNGTDGAIGGVAFPWASLPLAPLPLHPAQISVVAPGYPRQDPDETAAAFAFRRDRAGAHLDGLLPVGPDRRRMLREPHAWVLGFPLTDMTPAPLVVWPGSHRIIRAALAPCLTGPDSDVTDAYVAARREVLAACPRHEVVARPGQAILLHRMLIHGVAPFAGHERPPGRMVAYFRPLLPDVAAWLAQD
jgi:hypothetical protein